jgi:hypothetical protein
LPADPYIAVLLVRSLYVLTVTAPMLICSKLKGLISLLLTAGSAIVALLFFQHVFLSVWCFFAAVLAILLAVMFHRLPAWTAGFASALRCANAPRPG